MLPASFALLATYFILGLSFDLKMEARCSTEMSVDLQHYITCRKVAGSIFDEVTEFFN
jgi:hypothetical protein